MRCCIIRCAVCAAVDIERNVLVRYRGIGYFIGVFKRGFNKRYFIVGVCGRCRNIILADICCAVRYGDNNAEVVVIKYIARNDVVGILYAINGVERIARIYLLHVAYGNIHFGRLYGEVLGNG